MKKLQVVLVAAMLMGTAGISVAQDAQPQGGAPRGGRGIGMLLQGITLTAAQQTKVDSITKKYQDQRQAMMQELQSADQDTRRAKMREVMGKQSTEIKAVLTDEQKKVFEKNEADMRARMQQGGGRPPQG